MDIPEFELFKRMESLEQKTEGDFSLKDTFIVSMLAFEASYCAMAMHSPQNARKNKDLLIGKLKEMEFSKQWQDILEEELLVLCEHFESYK